MKPILKHLLLFSGKKLVRVGDLAIGDVIVDSESWEYKDGVNYGGSITHTEPIEWIVVAQNHPGYEGGTVLMSRWLAWYGIFDAAVLDWETASSRAFYRGTFYDHLSQYFRDNIMPVTTHNWNNNIVNNETIFAPSRTEMFGSFSSGDGVHFSGYFTSNADRIAYRRSTGDARNYWTRTRASTTVRQVLNTGADSTSPPEISWMGHRPTCVVNQSMLVTRA